MSDTSKGPFKRCSSCNGKVPLSDGHSLCLLCLGESHVVETCPHCLKLSRQSRRNRADRLKALLWKKALEAVHEPVPQASTSTAQPISPAMEQRALSSGARSHALITARKLSKRAKDQNADGGKKKKRPRREKEACPPSCPPTPVPQPVPSLPTPPPQPASPPPPSVPPHTASISEGELRDSETSTRAIPSAQPISHQLFEQHVSNQPAMRPPSYRSRSPRRDWESDSNWSMPRPLESDRHRDRESMRTGRTGQRSSRPHRSPPPPPVPPRFASLQRSLQLEQQRQRRRRSPSFSDDNYGSDSSSIISVPRLVPSPTDAVDITEHASPSDDTRGGL